MKFRVQNPEHSKAIQERLFEMGYKWEYSYTEVIYTDKEYLSTTLDGFIQWGTIKSNKKKTPTPKQP